MGATGASLPRWWWRSPSTGSCARHAMTPGSRCPPPGSFAFAKTRRQPISTTWRPWRSSSPRRRAVGSSWPVGRAARWSELPPPVRRPRSRESTPISRIVLCACHIGSFEPQPNRSSTHGDYREPKPGAHRVNRFRRSTMRTIRWQPGAAAERSGRPPPTSTWRRSSGRASGPAKRSGRRSGAADGQTALVASAHERVCRRSVRRLGYPVRCGRHLHLRLPDLGPDGEPFRARRRYRQPDRLDAPGDRRGDRERVRRRDCHHIGAAGAGDGGRDPLPARRRDRGSGPADGLPNVGERFLPMTEVTISSAVYPELGRTARAVAIQRQLAQVLLVTDDEQPDHLLADVLDAATAERWLKPREGDEA